jgi:hypothetical protein
MRPAAATGAHRPSFARQGHEALEGAIVTADAEEPMGEDATPEKAAELAFDEVG